ncbi:RNA polymerase sigma-70 factor [Dyella japonica]|uniref:RNA polymerase subunit sigma-24 n=1 Tax=Dyella japonica A8 TaxID=1217721 RepID=A0A075K2M6_9GAMM|nr:RNA polymerase sigma-70 factor [Dyella japonica]AIF48175.1 RNA polymerase subunit sigma-24 [Dyella japonica A8]
MNDINATFYLLRPRLQAIAYSMLGSIADAEDVVQDVWLRWHDAEKSMINNIEAWLVTTTTRVAIDRYRALKARREYYVGQWLPEPILADGPATPEQIHERHGEVSMALLSLLERLSPEARAAFLLREIFDVDYADIADGIGKNEASVRQIVHRAKSQLREGRSRYAVTPEVHCRIVERFAQAMALGQFQVLKSILAENAEMIGDGGGRVSSVAAPLFGGQRIAQLLYASTLRYKSEVRTKLAPINGEVSVLRYIHDSLESVLTVETNGDLIVRLLIQRNPEKLAGIASELGVPLFVPL